jgi:hypothetical protein
MDDGGFVYTLDAVLALIPVMIVLVGVSHLTESPQSYSETKISHVAQDSLEMMAQYHAGDGLTVLESMSHTLSVYQNNATGINVTSTIATGFLDKNLVGREYLLCEESQLDGVRLAGRLNLENASNVNTASRNCGNYTYRLYVGEE